jgi:hypothetical protein
MIDAAGRTPEIIKSGSTILIDGRNHDPEFPENKSEQMVTSI